MPSDQLARLALCSRVLFERTILEQQQQIVAMREEMRALKLRLFFSEYSVGNLQILMMRAGYRHAPRRPFEDWFLFMDPLMDGFTVVRVDGDEFPDKVDLDVHFACNSRSEIVSYGAKLWNATSVDDPELQRLVTIFDELNQIAEESLLLRGLTATQ